MVLILDNHAPESAFDRLRNVFGKKCIAKGLTIPSAAALVTRVREAEELASEWANMLGRQLPELPSLDGFLERFPAMVAWLDETPRSAVPRLPTATTGRGELPPLVAPRSVRYWGLGLPIDLIRFAGANRLMVSFDYHGKSRLVEPYSLRQPRTGNLLLYAWEGDAGHIKAFMIAEMMNLRVTGHSFSARYRIEFAA